MIYEQTSIQECRDTYRLYRRRAQQFGVSAAEFDSMCRVQATNLAGRREPEPGYWVTAAEIVAGWIVGDSRPAGLPEPCCALADLLPGCVCAAKYTFPPPWRALSWHPRLTPPR